jgi:FkbM family methyltransferase
MLGMSVGRCTAETNLPILSGTLQRLKKHGLQFRTVVDVGASDGRWSLELAHYFPNRSHLMLEANPIHEPALKGVCDARPGWHYALKAAGEREGQLFFDDSDPLGGHLSEKQLSSKYKPFPVTSIDAEVKRLALPPPFLVKLDTHGVEVPILNGALETLAKCEVVVMECYNFPGDPPCLSFWEMCKWMEARGFRPIDVHDILYRQYDQCFWQLDLVFARISAPQFGYSSFG